MTSGIVTPSNQNVLSSMAMPKKINLQKSKAKVTASSPKKKKVFLSAKENGGADGNNHTAKNSGAANLEKIESGGKNSSISPST